MTSVGETRLDHSEPMKPLITVHEVEMWWTRITDIARARHLLAPDVGELGRIGTKLS